MKKIPEELVQAKRTSLILYIIMATFFLLPFIFLFYGK